MKTPETACRRRFELLISEDSFHRPQPSVECLGCDQDVVQIDQADNAQLSPSDGKASHEFSEGLWCRRVAKGDDVELVELVSPKETKERSCLW